MASEKTKKVDRDYLEERLLKKDKENSRNQDFNYGYVVTRKNYISNAGFETLHYDLKTNYPDWYEGLKNGGGSELKEKDEKPPKFASISSSSRFVFDCFKPFYDKPLKTSAFFDEEVEYEKIIMEGKLQSLVSGEAFNKSITGATPNMDSILLSENHIVFVEGKCAEIYESKKTEFSEAYNAIIEKLKIENKISEVPKSHFDFAQAIKHMLGIRNFIKYSKKNSSKTDCRIKTCGEPIALDEEKNICLAFLIYDPKELGDEDLNAHYEKVIKEGEELIGSVFDKIFKEFKETGYNITYKFISQENLPKE